MVRADGAATTNFNAAFETQDELEALRAAARAEKRNFRYRRAADFDRVAALARMAREQHVVRFRMPAGKRTRPRWS